ncbi:unnamed protein product [Nezara viridula]|uniref:Uncharacterized protein n=1 Tax=Nezara viridula TaxID=85310 RepID=A0A9P0HNU4_NEZVI|nr:unnamed protein product [Nezara viridula]
MPIFPKTGKSAMILDPTMRYVTNDLDQAGKVEREKIKTYEKCIPLLSKKFRESFGPREFHVRGLWFGPLRTIPNSTRRGFFFALAMACVFAMPAPEELVRTKKQVLLGGYPYAYTAPLAYSAYSAPLTYGYSYWA